MQMLKNLLGSKKDYYLELDESQDKVVKAVEQAADTVQEKATKVAQSQPVQQAAEVVSQAKQIAQEAVSEVVPAEKPAANGKSAKAEAKPKAKTKTKAKSKQNGKVAKSDVKPQPAKPSLKQSGASSYEPPFWVAAMYKNSGNSSNGSTAEDSQTFATNNLMPTITKYRRRPGGSLNKFRDLAKKAKTPKG